MKLPHHHPKLDDAAAEIVSAGGFDPVSTHGGAPVRLAMQVLCAVFLPACFLAACSSDNAPVAPPGSTLSAEMVEKNCNDPHWREQNLGLWYSVCRPPLRW
jgi:hypothetical protein